MQKEFKNTTIGSRLFQLRKISKLSQDALAQLSEVSKSTLSRIENGSNTFSYNNLEKIAMVFGYRAEDLSKKEFDYPSEAQIKNSLKKYIKLNNLKIDFATLIKRNPGTAYYVSKMLETFFLDERREMNEIVTFFKNDFNVDLKGDNIANVLKRREQKGFVKRIPIKGTNKFYYQKK